MTARRTSSARASRLCPCSPCRPVPVLGHARRAWDQERSARRASGTIRWWHLTVTCWPSAGGGALCMARCASAPHGPTRTFSAPWLVPRCFTESATNSRHRHAAHAHPSVQPQTVIPALHERASSQARARRSARMQEARPRALQQADLLKQCTRRPSLARPLRQTACATCPGLVSHAGVDGAHRDQGEAR